MENQHSYFAVSIAPGKEEKVLENYFEILKRREGHGIYSVIMYPKVKGFVFIEADDYRKVADSIRKVPNMRKVISKEIPFEEIQEYIDSSVEETININKRDIVKIITGPFKGYRAKVSRIPPNKEEVIVELLDIPNPVPITLHPDDVKVIEEGDKEE